MMLLPASQRPSASELKEILNKLTVYFPENTEQNINFAENMLENISQEKEKNQMASLLQKQNEATSSFPSELMDPFSSSKFTEKEADLLIRKNYLADPTVHLQDPKKELSDRVTENLDTLSFQDRMSNKLKESTSSLAEKKFSFPERKNILQKGDKAVNFNEPGHLNETIQPLKMGENSLLRNRKSQRPSRLDGFFAYASPEKIDSDNHPSQIEMGEQNKDKRKAIRYRF